MSNIKETDLGLIDRSTGRKIESPFDFESMPPLEKCYLELSGVLHDVETSGFDDICKETLIRVQHTIGIINKKRQDYVPPNTSLYLCDKHGGIGFVSDCEKCKK